MKTYSLFIDETGIYALNDKKSFVGGCGAEKEQFNQFVKLFEIELMNEINNFNSINGDKINKDKYLNLLHFSDLSQIVNFNKSLNKSFQFKNITSELASKIIQLTKTHLINKKIDMYKVSGELNLYNGPQGNYLYQLCGVLIGAIEKNMAFDHFEFKIATRNLIAIYGDNFLGGSIEVDQGQESIAFHHHYKNYLEELLTNQYPLKTFKILFNVCAKDNHLPYADMALGLLKESSSDFAKQNLFLFSADEFIQKIAPTPTLLQNFEDGIRQSCQKDNTTLSSKCFVLFDLLKESQLPLDSILKHLRLLNTKELLMKELDLGLYSILNDYYQTYKYTNTYLVQKIINNLNSIYLKDSHLKLNKIFACFLRINFELDIHRGKSFTNKWKIYENYCDLNQKYLFNSPVEHYIEILSAKLIYIQSHFNSLDFQKIEDTLKPDKIKWEKVNSYFEPIKDYQNVLSAEIHGTLGQAYIFQGDLENSDFDKQEGLMELEKDLNYLDPTTPKYEHIANFIVTYYWLQKDLNASLKAFQNLKNSPNEETLYSITKTGSNSYSEPINTDTDIYKYLNQLRLIGLSLEGGKNISKETIKNMGIQIESLCEKNIAYPKFMLLKWLCYIYKNQGNELPKCVSEKLNAIQEIDLPLLKMMSFPLYYLIGNQDLYLSKINEFDTFCQSDGGQFFLKQRKPLIDKIKAGIATHAEVMRLMPYYYA